MERCTVAATQVDTRHLDVEHNLETHLRLIAETAEAGCGAQQELLEERPSPPRLHDFLARSEPGTDNRWIAVELDPALVDRARENPWFALKKRRPEAYAELVAHQ